MRANAIVCAALMATCGPALALETPVGSKADPRVQTAAYSPGNIIALHMAVGRAILVQLPVGESVTDVTVSDTVDMLPPVIVRNSATFKAKAPMQEMPLFIYAMTEGGPARVYKFEVDAKAVDGDDQPFSVTITDPAATAAAEAAKRAKAASAERAEQVKMELNTPPAAPRINRDYAASGNAALIGR